MFDVLFLGAEVQQPTQLQQIHNKQVRKHHHLHNLARLMITSIIGCFLTRRANDICDKKDHKIFSMIGIKYDFFHLFNIGLS